LTVGWRRCFLCGVCYLSPWQIVRRWVRRGPHAEWPGSVGVPCVVMGVCAEASLDRRDRRLCICSSRVIVPWWRSSGAVRACSVLRLWGDTALVTMAQAWAACFDLLSHLVEDGGVWCVCVCFVLGFVVWWCSLWLVMYHCCCFLYDIAVLLLLFYKNSRSEKTTHDADPAHQGAQEDLLLPHATPVANHALLAFLLLLPYLLLASSACPRATLLRHLRQLYHRIRFLRPSPH
jgi:hypothetical protein